MAPEVGDKLVRVEISNERDDSIPSNMETDADFSEADY